ncbi:MAG: DUF2169 family type VI secretion system accessory protein [bacterium]
MEIENYTPFMVEAIPFRSPEGKPILSVIVKGTFNIPVKGIAEIAYKQIPIFFGDEFYDSQKGGSVKFEADTVPFKPKTDVVLVGKAYAPGGRSTPFVDVTLQVGSLKKTMRVFGDRHWDFTSDLLSPSISLPIPFISKDLIYERAFGGMDPLTGGRCLENPLGKGYFDKKSAKTINNAALPNLEDPDHLIKNWDDHPKPVGFGFYGKTWMPRFKYLGTYDEKWQKERCPDLPLDFRYEFFNAAHPDLQIKGYLKGDEEVILLNLSPEGRLAFKLSGIKIKVTLTKSQGVDRNAPTVSEEVTMNLDTLCLTPEEKVFYQVWRGITAISDLGAWEVKKAQINII